MIDNYIPLFPDINGTDSQRILYNLQEFYELEANEQPENLGNKRGTYYKHQIVVARIMAIQDRLFVIHDPGSGKTCTFVGWDELLKKESAVIDEIIYITLKPLIVSTKHQILCKCTNRTYMTPQIENAKSQTEQEGAITRSIKKWYTMTTFHDFKISVKGKTSQQIKKLYSGKAFNVDEVSECIKLSKGKGLDDINFHYDVNRIDEPSVMNSDSEYIQLWRTFHCIDRSKVIIATATPMTNYVYEFFMLCNLVLPGDKQMPVSQLYQPSSIQNTNDTDIQLYSYDFTNLRSYEPYLNGLISFVAAPDTGAYANYIGNHVNISYQYPAPDDEWSLNPIWHWKEIPSQVILYKDEMFSLQAEAYFKMGSNASEDIEIGNKGNKFYVDENEITCYVDENGDYGSNVRYDPKILSQPFKRHQLASKFNTIYEIENRKWNETNGKPGCSYVYVELTTAGGHALREIFLANDYEEVDPDQITVADNKICSSSTVSKVSMTPGKKRFAFIDSATSATKREKILDVFSSENNVQGNYIQVLIGSRVFALGVNIGNVVRFFRVNPEWNEAKEKQTRDRVFRADSHDYVRKSIIKRDGIPNGQKVSIPVDFYNLCSFVRYYYIPQAVITIQNDVAVNNLWEYLFKQSILALPNNPYARRLSSFYICHFVGFLPINEVFKYEGQSLRTLVESDEYPWEKLGLKFFEDGNFYKQFISLYKTHQIVFSLFGELKCNTFKYIYGQYGLIVTRNGHFNKNTRSGSYENEFFLICKNEYVDSDTGLLPLSMKCFSGNEEKYLKSEKKSIPTRKILRYGKQYASDCLLNLERTYNKRNKDGSVECDFESCQYKCVADIANSTFDFGASSTANSDISNLEPPLTDNPSLTANPSSTANLARSSSTGGGGQFPPSLSYLSHSSNEKFFDNFEILYASGIIDQCVDDIIKMIKENKTVKISTMYKELSPKYRDYFIYEAVYTIIKARKVYRDVFGYACYISFTGNTIFLKREFPTESSFDKNSNNGYINKLIGVTSSVEYPIDRHNDENIVYQIENNHLSIGEIKRLISTFSIYEFNRSLIERVLFRLIHDRIRPNEQKLSLPNDSMIYEIFKSQIFHLSTTQWDIYVHNFVKYQRSLTRTAESNTYIKALDPFRIFVNETGTWRDASGSENESIRADVVKIIKSSIESGTIYVLPPNFPSQMIKYMKKMHGEMHHQMNYTLETLISFMEFNQNTIYLLLMEHIELLMHQVHQILVNY